MKQMDNIFTKYCDKLAHVGLCAYAVLALSLFLQVFLAMWIVVVLCIAKELSDKYVLKCEADWQDLVADVVGIALGLLPIAFK